MSADPPIRVSALLDLLDGWRHFPSYQLERRADIFFALYLPGIIGHVLGVQVDRRVIPEFPVKREDNNQSTKVDYFLISSDRSRAFLVELKTEMESRNEKQDAYLVAARERGLNALLRDIPLIAAASNQQAKYVHLLSALEDMGLMTLPGDLDAYAFPKVRRGITDRLRSITIAESDAAIEVIYLQPRDTSAGGIISFQTVAEYLSSLDDPLALVFADYVRRWIEPAALRPAGEGAPLGPRVDGTDAICLRRTYTIQSRKAWDDDVNAAAIDFHARFGVFPNVLLANPATFRRIGMVTDIDNVWGPGGERPEEGEFCEIGVFSAADYELECAYEDELPDRSIALVYSSDPGGGDGIWAPDEDTELPDASKRAVP